MTGITTANNTEPWVWVTVRYELDIVVMFSGETLKLDDNDKPKSDTIAVDFPYKEVSGVYGMSADK